MNYNQLPLEPNPHIELCVKCQAQIVTVDYPDHTTSDYRNAKGECFKCSREK